MGRAAGLTSRLRASALPRSAARLLRLPDEILIIIIEHCDIDAFLNLRLTCRAFRNLIHTYESTIVQAVARTTFPECRLLLRPPPSNINASTLSLPVIRVIPKSPYTIKWLTGLIPKHLASIVVDRHRYCGTPLPMLDGIPSEDEVGDELRRHVAHGFRILEALSLIAKDVEETPDSKIESKLPKDLMRRRTPPPAWPNRMYRKTKKALWSWRRPQETAEKQRKAILQRRQDLTTALQCHYIYNKLTPEGARDFDAMWTILRMAFQHRRYFTLGTETLDWCKPDRRDVFFGDSWVNWFVFEAGASFWWKHYWLLKIRHADRKAPSGWQEINRAFYARPRDQMVIERAGAAEVYATMHHRMKGVDRIRLPSSEEYEGMIRSLQRDPPEDRLKYVCASMTLY